MEVVRPAVLSSSECYKLFKQSQQASDLVSNLPADLEELQALALVHSLFLWHGSQKQRQRIREEFGILANITRRTGMLRSLPREDRNSSALHQPGPVTGEEVNTWNWTTWIENEKRTRLMAYVFLIDSASTIFFNTQPQFDVHELEVPLPADDAAWDARNAEDCANALGLRGQAAQVDNVSGSRRAKQLGMAEALEVLYEAGHNRFPERATNVFGKFCQSTQFRYFRRIADQIASTHTCDSYPNIQHPTATPAPRLYKWHEHATIRNYHTTQRR
jgi:hypothetical protein